MASVFLSYDRDDAVHARPLAAALEKAGHSVWWDTHISGGAQFAKEIEQALNRADAVVVLWTSSSVESAWVRDEAAAGRDRGRLIPLTLKGTPPPLGFRQFQSIELGNWRGRDKVPRFREILSAIARQSNDPDVPIASASPSAEPKGGRQWKWGAVAILLLALTGAGWLLFRPNSASALPVVTTAASDNSAPSRAMAQALFRKLGTLAEIGSGKWQLVDASDGTRRSDYIFQTADTGSESRPQAAVTLLDGKTRTVLWSRDFEFPAGRSADLQQQAILTAGRVLDCALEAREKIGLRRDLLKSFLNGCAELAEGDNNTTSLVVTMGNIVAKDPAFTPAWSRLLLIQAEQLSHEWANNGALDGSAAVFGSIRAARKADPNLPEAFLAEAALLPPNDYGRKLDLIQRAKKAAPDKAEMHEAEASALGSVGRMAEAIDAAKRAARLDPLSPATQRNLIATLAAAGRTDAAREQLARAERIWAGTVALREAQWLFHLRYGDPKIALRMAAEDGDTISPILLRYRMNPTEQNASQLAILAKRLAARSSGYPLQGLGEAGQTDEAFELMEKTSIPRVAATSYFLFRPALNEVRRDPRFMQVAKRIGLLDYWRTSGKWPDFCADLTLPYDCKAEAAKLN